MAFAAFGGQVGSGGQTLVTVDQPNHAVFESLMQQLPGIFLSGSDLKKLVNLFECEWIILNVPVQVRFQDLSCYIIIPLAVHARRF